MKDHTYIRIGKELLEKREASYLTISPEKAMKNADELFRELKKISWEIQNAYEDVVES